MVVCFLPTVLVPAGKYFPLVFQPSFLACEDDWEASRAKR